MLPVQKLVFLVADFKIKDGATATVGDIERKAFAELFLDFTQAAVKADDDMVGIDEIYDKDYEDDNGDSDLVIAWN